MEITFDQLINLPELKDLKLVSGKKGIFRRVKWVHIMETPDIVSYAQSDEVIILTGVAIFDDKDGFVELIKGLIKKDAAGLIVNVGKYFSKVPDYIKKISDENNFPVFEIPWKISLSEVTKVICNHIVKAYLEELPYENLLKNIISDKVTYEDFTKRLSDSGYTSFKSFRIIIVSMDRFQEYLYSKNIKDEQSIFHMKSSFLRCVNSSIWDAKFQPISFLEDESVVFLMINEKDKLINLEKLLEFIRENGKKNFLDINLSIAVGNAYTRFFEIKTSYLEALKTLKVIKSEGSIDKNMFYSNIGAYKLLSEIKNVTLLKEYYDETVGILEQYDAQNDTDFTHIFYVFIEKNGNYIQTSKKLYLHRNTLMYKINKIQEILKKDLTDTKVKFEFYLGYLIKNFNNF
ncbi:transcriptional regulator [Clostridium carboxidivorans P7]|uniref:Transcriptional regulator, PucR family n=1 Tax=Clostridium carboxidivorans P7 TaxID=536227 RepID=C6PUC3_9CLOT|nr:PucR family transcriptional regulator [Clostridium carboxidivorans]AKN30573.1 transcriptional regulator [Clostridium carboxidivorans P7]EET87121.1 transcriptional regulator, PucR family [Clostridium carboxidivorans P7]EFG86321.1 purine catabolism regulatory protein-like family protein [Clostridium carboxidivorans P7]